MMTGPILLIRLDNKFLVNFVCSKVVGEDVQVSSIMQMAMMGDASSADNLNLADNSATPVDTTSVCINSMTVLSIFGFLILNTIQGQQAYVARMHRDDQVAKESILEKQQEDMKKIEVKRK